MSWPKLTGNGRPPPPTQIASHAPLPRPQGTVSGGATESATGGEEGGGGEGGGGEEEDRMAAGASQTAGREDHEMIGRKLRLTGWLDLLFVRCCRSGWMHQSTLCVSSGKHRSATCSPHLLVVQSPSPPFPPPLLQASLARGLAHQDAELGLQRPLFPLHGFSDQTVTSDTRFKVALALRNVGLHETEYAR